MAIHAALAGSGVDARARRANSAAGQAARAYVQFPGRVPACALVLWLFLSGLQAAAQEPAAEESTDNLNSRAFAALQSGDLPTAAQMFEELGDRGVPHGYTMLGQIKRDLGDNADAARWFERGAEGGDVSAMLEGGEILSDPQYGLTDARRAFRLWKAAAEKGAARGQYEAGRALMTGKGTRQDDAAGADWIEKSARQCYAPAQFAYALVLREGRGREANGEDAFSWLIAAQRANDDWSETDLDRLGQLEQEIPAYMSSAQVARAYCKGLKLLTEACGTGGILLAIESWIACKG